MPEANGRLTIYSCTQAMYFSMGVVAAHLQWPLSKLKFVGGTVGGGFGGKVDTATETITSLLAIKSRRPVKWRFTREEEFLVSSTRAPWHIEIKDAVTKDGWILGRRMLTLHDAGAYARFSPYGLTKHAFHHTGAYTIPNLRFDGFVDLHQPRAHHRHARVRRDVGVARGRDAPHPGGRGAGDRPARAAAQERQPHRTTRRATGWSCTTRRRSAVTLAAAEAAGLELGDEYRAMTDDRRTGDLLPEHLVAQQAPESAERLATYDPTRTNGGGH